jgi:N-acetyl-anhydromuramyl-L-alanine amidase AmpD
MIALITVGILLRLTAPAQQQNILGFKLYFEEAYWRYPNLPKGVLEAAAYAASRLTNLQPQAAEADNCTGMPLRYGVYALVENGQGYFKNNLLTVCSISNITPEQYKNDVRLQILAVAKFCSREASMRRMDVRISAEDFSVVLDKLCEIPDDSSAVNTYARALYKYAIYDQMQKGFTTPAYKQRPMVVEMDEIFPIPLLKKLQAPEVEVNYDKDTVLYNTTPVYAVNRIVSINAITAVNNNPNSNSINNALYEVKNGEYKPALYIPASTNNYQSGRGGAAITHIAIHTTQGSYAAAISWFKNPGAAVSAHYIVRASDGQITQMVREEDMAYHAHSANAYTIGITHEGYTREGDKWYSDKMYRSSAALVRDICNRRSISDSACFRGMATAGVNYLADNIHIKGHQHYSASLQTDPGKYWNWTKYADLLMNKLPPELIKNNKRAVKKGVTTVSRK